MKFSNNLKTIMNTLDCSNNELANYSNLDRALISKFRNDIRIPTENSDTLNSLINGLCEITTIKNKQKVIKTLCNNDEDVLFDTISKFFITNSNNIRLQKDNNTLIGTNLDILMKTLNISNAMLSKYLSKDASLISKYKTGIRFLMRNDILVDQICNYISKYIIDNNLLKEAYSLLNITNSSDLKNNIYSFLFTKYTFNSPINSFLESLSDFKISNFVNILNVNSLVSKEILKSKKENYIGVEEFRESVKRLLGNTCLNDTRTTLYLYSDESMKWMFQDKNFYNTWKMLMINTLIKKNRIKIIHNINRNTDEMFKAIESWLPLYMTGLIDPYYNIKNNNTIFNHTLFISDNIAVINSLSTFNNKNDNNIYNYSENKDIIINYKDQFLQLLVRSNRLVKIYVNNEIDEKIKDNDLYNNYSNVLENIVVKIKDDESEVLVLKTDSPRIMFEFTYPKMIDAFKKYISKN